MDLWENGRRWIAKAANSIFTSWETPNVESETVSLEIP